MKPLRMPKSVFAIIGNHQPGVGPSHGGLRLLSLPHLWHLLGVSLPLPQLHYRCVHTIQAHHVSPVSILSDVIRNLCVPWAECGDQMYVSVVCVCVCVWPCLVHRGPAHGPGRDQLRISSQKCGGSGSASVCVYARGRLLHHQSCQF
jgi:hypothetical protein